MYIDYVECFDYVTVIVHSAGLFLAEAYGDGVVYDVW